VAYITRSSRKAYLELAICEGYFEEEIDESEEGFSISLGGDMESAEDADTFSE
jgi:hypothetical protein